MTYWADMDCRKQHYRVVILVAVLFLMNGACPVMGEWNVDFWNSAFKLDEFATNGSVVMEEDGRICQWNLQGEGGDNLENGVISVAMPKLTLLFQKADALKNVTAETTTSYENQIFISSPECEFNGIETTLSSKKTIHIEAGDFSISGRGYKIFLKNKIITIHNKVRISMPPLGKIKSEVNRLENLTK